MSAEPILKSFGAQFDSDTLIHYGDAQKELDALTTGAGLFCQGPQPFTLEGEDVQRWQWDAQQQHPCFSHSKATEMQSVPQRACLKIAPCILPVSGQVCR